MDSPKVRCSLISYVRRKLLTFDSRMYRAPQPHLASNAIFALTVNTYIPFIIVVTVVSITPDGSVVCKVDFSADEQER